MHERELDHLDGWRGSRPVRVGNGAWRQELLEAVHRLRDQLGDLDEQERRFLPADDERVLATIDATEERLTDGRGLVYRYRAHDGLAGEEGSFLLCTFWLAEALARAGQIDRARDVCDRAVTHVNDVGLLSEEIDPDTGELIGNFPQAFSHIGLVNAAWAIAQAEREATGTDEPRRPGE